MPGVTPIGKKGEESHDNLIKQLEEYWEYYSQALSPRFQEMVGDKKLWLGYREDKRKAHEKWRSWSWLGDPARMTGITVNAWLEIMGSSDPPIQCEGVDQKDAAIARGFEAWGDYMLRGNKWTATQEMLFRNLDVMGWQPVKTGWREIKYQAVRRPTKEQLIDFDTQLNEAMKTGLVSTPPQRQQNGEPARPEDAAKWRQWYEDNSQVYPNTPKPLSMQTADTITYRGPWYYYPSPFQLRFDPFVEDLTQHEIFFERFVKPRSWTEAQVKAGKFDAAQVAAAGNGWDNKRLSEWDAQIANEIGLTYSEADPTYRNADEFWEVWRPNHPQSHLVIMNRTACVSTDYSNPWWHRQLPYHFIKNVPVSGHPFGLSSYQQLRRTFADRCTFRDMLLDMMVLHGLGVYLKRRSLGLTDMQRFLQPGMILDVNDNSGFSSALGSITGFGELMQIGQMLLGDQQTLSSTGENVAGQPATVGRVSATETQSRLQQALVPHKKKAERLEEEESATLPQMYYNVYQMMPNEDPQLKAVRAQIAGEEGADPFDDKRFNRETFAEVLNINVRFRGATNKLNKELFIQQLKDVLGTFAQIQSAAGVPVSLLSPGEMRNIARRVVENFSIKGMDQIITKEGDQAVELAVQAYLINAQAAPIAAQNQLLAAQQQMAATQAAMGTQPLQDQSQQVTAQSAVIQAQTALIQAQQQLQALQQPPPPPEPEMLPQEHPDYKVAPPDIQRQMEQKAGFQPSQMVQNPLTGAMEQAQPQVPQEEPPAEEMPPQEEPQ